MNKEIKNVVVYASASPDVDEIYYKTATELANIIVKEGFGIVYGGSRRGLMYACAGNVQNCGGRVVGVMPQKFVDLGFANPQDCTEFYVTKGMRERKAKLDELSDAVIAISGGFGTLEEISEMIVQKILGYNNKPIVFLNTNHFYDNLFEFFEQLIFERFAQTKVSYYYYLAQSPEEVIGYLKTYVPNELPKTVDDIYVKGNA